MAEVKQPKKTGVFSGAKSASVIFGDKEYIIKKLRAGNFYKALKVYMDMIQDVAPKTSKGKDAEIDLDTLIVSMFQSWPEKMVEFIAVCCVDIDTKNPLIKERILKIAYPEEITKAFAICLDLNDVAGNLKKCAAPIGKRGADINEAKGK